MAELPPRIADRDSSKVNETLRSVSKGAEKWLFRPVKCLDKGFVYLVDYMGNDGSIARAARVSYGRGTRKLSDDEALIRYLYRNAHTTPFEMVEFKFHCQMPIFVARQWIRHRTASVNEYSGRFSEMLDEFYVPDISAIRKQSGTNKQGRAEESLAPEIQAEVIELLKREYESQFGLYKKFLGFDLSRELARIGLSVANYTRWYWKIDLHNLLHFLKLRLDPHAQYEIRVYAEAMAMIVRDAVPASYQAFADYRLNAIIFSAAELEILGGNCWPMQESEAIQAVSALTSKRERDGFLNKLRAIKLVR